MKEFHHSITPNSGFLPGFVFISKAITPIIELPTQSKNRLYARFL